ncbi:hypothetical protein HHK36_032353 [Tetracentron sinense]|uniref:Uncharacterized protein n=1 Tax=Tetracentron sinense TaxID=13715 RepID=A0A834Y595_TETSI|nr:hypothetical protein HHK36_032353 [Tetracentron sinense]
MRKIPVSICGMTYAACLNLVESALIGVIGVVHTSVALLQNKANVVFDQKLVKHVLPYIEIYNFARMLEKRSLSHIDGLVTVPLDDPFILENVQRIHVCEKVIYEYSLKQRLLQYVACDFLFTAKGVEHFLVSWNRVEAKLKFSIKSVDSVFLINVFSMEFTKPGRTLICLCNMEG